MDKQLGGATMRFRKDLVEYIADEVQHLFGNPGIDSNPKAVVHDIIGYCQIANHSM